MMIQEDFDWTQAIVSPVVLNSSESIFIAANLLEKSKLGLVICLDNLKKPTGVISDGDMRVIFNKYGPGQLIRLLSYEIMTKNFISCRTTDSFDKIIDKFYDQNRPLNVMPAFGVNDELVGVISVRNLLQRIVF